MSEEHPWAKPWIVVGRVVMGKLAMPFAVVDEIPTNKPSAPTVWNWWGQALAEAKDKSMMPILVCQNLLLGTMLWMV